MRPYLQVDPATLNLNPEAQKSIGIHQTGFRGACLGLERLVEGRQLHVREIVCVLAEFGEELQREFSWQAKAMKGTNGYLIPTLHKHTLLLVRDELKGEVIPVSGALAQVLFERKLALAGSDHVGVDSFKLRDIGVPHLAEGEGGDVPLHAQAPL